jgi:hypothetical protein
VRLVPTSRACADLRAAADLAAQNLQKYDLLAAPSASTLQQMLSAAADAFLTLDRSSMEVLRSIERDATLTTSINSAEQVVALTDQRAERVKSDLLTVRDASGARAVLHELVFDNFLLFTDFTAVAAALSGTDGCGYALAVHDSALNCTSQIGGAVSKCLRYGYLAAAASTSTTVVAP